MSESSLRIGNGFDIHRLEPGIPLYLAGIKIDFEKGLKGHSDGDVITHAVIDSLLGAAGRGDIGQHFPSDDDWYKGIKSLNMLEKIMEILDKDHFQIVNVDTTIICQEPKLAPYYKYMRESLAEVLGIDSRCVNVKAKTAERLGIIGEGNAMAAYAVSLLKLRPKETEL